MGFCFTENFVIGATMVCASTYVYGAYPVAKRAAIVEATSVTVAPVDPPVPRRSPDIVRAFPAKLED